jgi:SHS2 domain-containing protein
MKKPQQEKRYEPFSHPSDIGLSVYGNSLEQLFENAAYGLFDTLCNLDKVNETVKVDVGVVGDDRESLMINFLNELLYLQSIKGWLFRRFKVQAIKDNRIKAIVWGEYYQANNHEIYREIKCATYHNLKIRQEDGLWRVDIVFDV